MSMLGEVAPFQARRTVFIPPTLFCWALSWSGPGVGVGVGLEYELRLAGDAVGEDSHQRVANRETARTGSHHSDRRGSERAVQTACYRIHGQEKRLLIGEAQ